MSMYHDSAISPKASKIRRGFYIHLAAYVLVNALLVGINLATTPDRWWFYWPLAGWGVGILAHAAVFAFHPCCRQRAV